MLFAVCRLIDANDVEGWLCRAGAMRATHAAHVYHTGLRMLLAVHSFLVALGIEAGVLLARRI